MSRDYRPLLERIGPGAGGSGGREAAMRAVVDAIWDEFGIGSPREGTSSGAVSWAGFYVWSKSSPEEMTLGPRRDKPACSPIGMHGACGRCFSSRRALVVTDVAKLGAGYIACDPRDRSEVVVPCVNPDGSAWGVLDLDSYEVDAFDAFDALSLTRLMRSAGLTAQVSDSEGDVEVV
ncbi:MAG: GAF domain-containing protein [Phycisphaerales bacterium]